MSGPIKDLEEPRACRQWIPGLVWTAVLGLLLLLPGPATGQTDEEIEEVFWGSVECQSARQVQAYLEVYPTGRYVAEAWGCLEGQLGLDRAARILVQQGLAALDYSAGVADGLFGPATRRAIRAWQAAKAFEATGYLTREQADTLMAQGREAVTEQRRREEARRQAQAEAERRRQAQEAERQRVAEAERQAREAEAERQRQAQEAAERAEAKRQRQTCVGRSEGTECWMELAGRPRCYVFTFNFRPGISATWTGECVDGLAHGMGTLTFARDGRKSAYTGLIRGGKRHGHSIIVIHTEDGDVSEGPFVDGRMHGRWVMRRANGAMQEGSYTDGKRQGHWVERQANGDVWEGRM